MMNSEILTKLLNDQFSPTYLNVQDESEKHAGHAGAKESGGGHYIVTMTSGQFNGLSLIQSHRLVNAVLKDYFGRDIHALTLNLKAK